MLEKPESANLPAFKWQLKPQILYQISQTAAAFRPISALSLLSQTGVFSARRQLPTLTETNLSKF